MQIIKDWWSRYFVSRDTFDLSVGKLTESMRKIDELERVIRAVEVQKTLSNLVSKPKLPVAGFDSTDCEPSDTVAREEYVKNVDFFYDAVMKDKLKTSIADIREMLSNVHVANGLNMQRGEYDFFLRGMETFAWKMNEWATTLQGERRQILQDKENQ